MKKSNLPFESKGLTCIHCGKELTQEMRGNVIFVRECDAQGHAIGKIVDVALVSKECDGIVQEYYRQQKLNPTLWHELSHYTNPMLWMSFLLQFIDDMKKGCYTPEAAEKMKTILWETYPYVARDITKDEENDGRILLSI